MWTSWEKLQDDQSQQDSSSGDHAYLQKIEWKSIQNYWNIFLCDFNILITKAMPLALLIVQFLRIIFIVEQTQCYNWIPNITLLMNVGYTKKI